MFGWVPRARVGGYVQKNSRRMQLAVALLILCPFPAVSGDQAQSASGSLEVIGITAPNQTALLASVHPAKISRIAFPEGSYVREGDVVVWLDDGVQRARTHLARITMETTLPVELERAKLVKAQRDLDRLKRLHGSDYASSKELSDALSALEIAEVSYNMAVFQQAQSSLEHQRESEVLKEYQLTAPFDGYVAAHLKFPGETIDQLEGVVRLAQLNPLVVTVDCPLELARVIEEGDQFPVRPSADGDTMRLGTVVFSSEVADAASQTFRVKLKIDNADRAWLAGWKVRIDFGAEAAKAGDVASRIPQESGSQNVQR